MEIIEITKEYGVKVVFCTNSETLGIKDEGLSLTESEIACDVVRSGQESIFESLGGYGNEDSFFKNWNGGKYSCGSNIYASFWKREIELNEDGEESFGEWEFVDEYRWSKDTYDIPTDIVLKIKTAIEAADGIMSAKLDEYENMRSYAAVEFEVEKFNEQWENAEDITADVDKVVEENADKIIESEKSTHVIFEIGEKKYEVTYHQNHHGKWSAHLHEYKVDGEDMITFDILREKGEKLDSAQEGTCFLYRYNDTEYVVLADNTVITREEDNESAEGAIFPY